ncbi:MAG: NHL repeat-containing protein [Candidatus Saccharimonadaceae bacterium]
MKRSASKKGAGFTIVELVVVIVVIAILAAITIVSYRGISTRAIEASMQSDLQSAVSLIENDNTQNGAYPTMSDGLNSGKGLVGSGSNQITYLQLTGGFCVSVTNPKTSSEYKITNTSGQAVSGTCDLGNSAVVTTVAGSVAQTAGYVDANGLAARFDHPLGIAVDNAGNLYVSDANNNRIRKITTNGDVTTFSGSGVAGSVDGSPTTAKFYYPRGVAIDSTGNVYTGDYIGTMVRKLTSSGTVSTLAGSMTGGYVDATGSAARFAAIQGITVDGSGNIYTVENRHRIRKITPAGVVTTVAGSGTEGYLDGNGITAQFAYPAGIAIDSSGAMYIADSGNHRIRKLMPNGDVTTFAGSGVRGYAEGMGTAAQFDTPTGITIDATGTIYVADSYNNSIRKITSAGRVTTFAGSKTGSAGYADGVGTAARFSNTATLTVDTSGVVYVVEGTGNRIRKIQ